MELQFLLLLSREILCGNFGRMYKGPPIDKAGLSSYTLYILLDYYAFEATI